MKMEYVEYLLGMMNDVCMCECECECECGRCRQYFVLGEAKLLF